MNSKYNEYRMEYSQNRLQSRKLVSTLVDKSSIVKGDIVYDIGAGCGIISEELAKRQARVIAIEQDNRLHNKLKQKLDSNPLVVLRHGNFLAEPLPEQEKYKVFANIPFMLTADIVRKLLFRRNPPDDCYLVMQREAARKFAGIPKENLFSLLLKPWFALRVRHSFQKADFSPVPSVNIVLLQIERREQALVADKYGGLYRDFLVYGFSQGKTTMRNTFKKIFTHTQFMRLSKDLGFRPEGNLTELSFRQWLGLFDFFSREVDNERRQLVTDTGKISRWQWMYLKKIYRTRQPGV